MREANYFRPAPDGLWKWEDRARVIAWRDGTTVAYAEEIQTILQDLTGKRVPDLQMIILLIAACRDSWSGAQAHDICARGNEVADNASEAGAILVDAKLAVEQLQKLHQLPSDLRSGLNSLRAIVLLAIEFEPVDSELDGLKLAHLLAEGLTPDMLQPRPQNTYFAPSYWNVLKSIVRAFEGLTPQTLEVCLRSGYANVPNPKPPIPAEVLETDGSDSAGKPGKDAEAEALTPRDLIADLRRDSKFAALGGLAQHLLAVMTIPHDHKRGKDESIGGLSDITNRGEPDKLLVSELAQDNDVLVTRLANNEALYLRRERLPSQPGNSRYILLDSSLRCWGLPRLMILAVGLAVQAEERGPAYSRPHVHVFGLRDARFSPIELGTQSDILKQMASLDASLNSAQALQEFAASVAQEPHTDLVFVTHRQTLQDPEITETLKTVNQSGIYGVSVEAETLDAGLVELKQYTLGFGWKTLGSAAVPLAELLNTPQEELKPRRSKRKHSELVDREQDPDLPIILQEDYFPFLLPFIGKVSTMTVDDEFGIFFIAKDRRLLFQDGTEHSLPEQIVDRVPRSTWRRLFIQRNEKRIVCLNFDSKTRQLVLNSWNFDGLEPKHRVCEIEPKVVHAAWPQNDWVIVHYDKSVAALNLNSGAVAAAATLKDLELDFRGLVLTRYDSFTRKRSNVHLSYDGHKLQVWKGDHPNGQVDRLQHKKYAALTAQSQKIGSSYFKNFNRVGITADGELFLPLRNHFTNFVLRVSGKNYFEFLLVKDGECDVIALAEFAEPYKCSTGNWMLRCAQWSNGSRVYHDSRGMLHIVSADNALPQVSVVLVHTRQTAVWTSKSDGAGNEIFLEDCFGTIAAEVVKDLDSVLGALL